LSVRELIDRRGSCGRPCIHPAPGDRYTLPATKSRITILAVSESGDVLAAYLDRHKRDGDGRLGYELTLTVNFLREHATIQHRPLVPRQCEAEAIAA
jgi:hypothetical protein